MKRTKQRADRAGQALPENTSGCRQFEGEDLSKCLFLKLLRLALFEHHSCLRSSPHDP